MKHYTLICGVPYLRKRSVAPRHTPFARSCHPHLPQTVEADIEQDQISLRGVQFQKCVQFGVHFFKHVPLFFCHRVSLEPILTHRNNFSLTQNQRDVLFLSPDAQAQGISVFQEALNSFCVHNSKSSGGSRTPLVPVLPQKTAFSVQQSLEPLSRLSMSRRMVSFTMSMWRYTDSISRDRSFDSSRIDSNALSIMVF